ncbi:PAS domain-containing protein [Engelhardtia mirabilis]|uniref:Aerotaxis receptor n=1 Tax=Engelhardtia mirabilis TaxID=2528011 RepID=A0A518BI24_9BACT|nr:Aerotaxis receptor [Planctomycetes bacterium Pla133]QDV00919.1 Aerotaxis receptor [Planctomycetes bacterium Pla86]
MARSKVVPVDRSADFDLSELFFSTTDPKGRIKSCNDVFLRIAGYPASEAIGAPHSLVRHPDMPRCVFRLLWSYLGAGKPIGAYVKNMTSNGEFYWVFAVALPIESGYLSVRLKPTSGVIPAVEELYAKLLATEAGFGTDTPAAMDASTAQLVEALGTLGYESYDRFMVKSLRSEIMSRRTLMPRTSAAEGSNKTGRMFAILEDLELLDHLRDVANDQARSSDGVSRSVNRIALNSSICAARMDERGRALGVVSEQTSIISGDISREARILETEQSVLDETIEQTSLQVSVATLLVETEAYFLSRSHIADADRAQQIEDFGATCEELSSMLKQSYSAVAGSAAEGVAQLRKSLRTFGAITDRFSRILLTAKVNHVTGRSISETVEGGQQFSGLLDELAGVSNAARASLDELQDLVDSVDRRVKRWNLQAVGA